MNEEHHNINWRAVMIKRTICFGLGGSLAVGLIGALLQGLLNAALVVAVPGAGQYWIGTSGFLHGGLIALPLGFLTFAAVGALKPSQSGLELFSQVLQRASLSMSIGEVLGALGGVSLGACVIMTWPLAKSGLINAFTAAAAKPVFCTYSYYGALFVMVVGLLWSTYKTLTVTPGEQTTSYPL